MNVFIITGSQNEWAIEQWKKEVESRDSPCRIFSAEKWRSAMVHADDETSFLVDVVNSGEFPEHKFFIRCLLNSGRRYMGACRRIVLLTAEWNFEEFARLEGNGFWVHGDSEGEEMDACFNYLTGHVPIYHRHHDEHHQSAVMSSRRVPAWW